MCGCACFHLSHDRSAKCCALEDEGHLEKDSDGCTMITYLGVATEVDSHALYAHINMQLLHLHATSCLVTL